ncbi:MAG: hypothetical protein KC431_04955, partial [Myxococcales bacterium]|nr:hypothetical protein [Myxococcales bacterium]
MPGPRFPVLVLMVLALGACNKDPNDSKGARKVSAEELPEPEYLKIEGLELTAAGVTMTVPKDWKLLVEDEPNFALAFDPSEQPTHAPVCTIELRRQGPGELPSGAKIGPTQDEERVEDDSVDYAIGPIRGRMRSLPGPTVDARVFVH